MDRARPLVYEFGPFRLDPAERLLFRNGKVVPLTPKAFDTLLVLVRRSGHVVRKQDLMKEIWPDTFVEEAGLARNISALRSSLGEKKGETPFIETIPKRGYRFVAPVRIAEAEQRHAGETPSPSPVVVPEEERPRRAVPDHVVLGWCPSCGRHVWVVSPDEAAAIIGASPRVVYRAIEDGSAHFTETAEGRVLVCVSSLVNSAGSGAPEA